MSVRAVLAGLLVAFLVAPAFQAQVLVASPDTTLEVGPADLLVRDEDVVRDDPMASAVLEDLGTLPSGSEVNGFGRAANGDRLFCLDVAAALPGGITAEPRDVVRYDGASYSIELDGEAAGVPRSAKIDALSRSAGGLTLSFDTTVLLGGGLVAADEDLVLWNGASFSSALDGSAEGIDASLDVDAVEDLGGGDYLISLDGSADVGGTYADDDDVLRFEAGTGFSLELDTSTTDADWAPADLIAVPEPGALPGLLAGGSLLAGLSRRRGRR